MNEKEQQAEAPKKSARTQTKVSAETPETQPEATPRPATSVEKDVLDARGVTPDQESERIEDEQQAEKDIAERVVTGPEKAPEPVNDNTPPSMQDNTPPAPASVPPTTEQAVVDSVNESANPTTVERQRDNLSPNDSPVGENAAGAVSGPDVPHETSKGPEHNPEVMDRNDPNLDPRIGTGQPVEVTHDDGSKKVIVAPNTHRIDDYLPSPTRDVPQKEGLQEPGHDVDSAPGQSGVEDEKHTSPDLPGNDFQLSTAEIRELRELLKKPKVDPLPVPEPETRQADTSAGDELKKKLNSDAKDAIGTESNAAAIEEERIKLEARAREDAETDQPDDEDIVVVEVIEFAKVTRGTLRAWLRAGNFHQPVPGERFYEARIEIQGTGQTSAANREGGNQDAEQLRS